MMSAELPRQFSVPPELPALESSRVGANWRPFWIVTAAVAAMIFLRDVVNTGPGLSIHGEAIWGRDFVNVYTSGILLIEGRLGVLYDVEAYRAFQHALFDGGLRYHNYSYPPVTLLYTWAFALLPYPLALVAWLGGTGALFVAAARPYLKRAGLPAWLALVAPASLINIWAGHYGFLLGALWLAAWHHLPRRPLLAGVLIGLMAVKPHLAVLAPLVLLWRHEWKAMAAAAVTASLLAALSGALFGFDLWITYVTETARLQAAMVDDTGSFFITMMPTLTPSLALIGTPLALATALQGGVAIAAIIILLRNLPKDSMDAGLATGAATFLVLPYAFSYDMTVVGLGALLLYRGALCDRRGEAFALLAVGAALAPMIGMYFNLFRFPISPPLIAFQLLAALGLLRSGGRAVPAPAR